MTTPLRNEQETIAYLTDLLPEPPSAGLRRMVADLAATGLPLCFQTVAGSRYGAANLSPEGITLSLADRPVDEAVVAHEMAHALLEIRGWPCLFAAEPNETWVGRLQTTLATLLDHSAGTALQRAYGVAFEAYEQALLDDQAKAIQELHSQARALMDTEMTGEQEVEYGIGIALTVLERFWRTANVPADFWNALELIPGSRALFDSLSEFAPVSVPTTGWPSRQLMGAIIERIDDYLEIKGDVRPIMVLSHFVPAIHPADAAQATGNVARLIMVPLQTDTPGEHSIMILPHRDHLPFGFRQVLPDEAAIRDFADRMARARYADFCRALVPESFLLWAPTGEPYPTIY